MANRYRKIKDIWNSFMVDGATFSQNDIPNCPTVIDVMPKQLISFVEAKTVHRKKLKEGQVDYRIHCYIHFWIDDYKFDGCCKGIWNDPFGALEIIRHFDGIITPDFSTYLDFPEPIKTYNTYRMRTFGYWISKQNINVINNVRWGGKETWRYSFDGITKNSVVAIGTVASGLADKNNLSLFEEGLIEMIKVLQPHTIILYGASKLDIIKQVRTTGITVIEYQSKLATVFKNRR